MDNKELFNLIEEYGTTMKEFGYLTGTRYLSDPKRKEALVTACKLIAKIERELGERDA